MKQHPLLTVLILLALCTACQKEPALNNRLELFIEPMNGAKLVLDGTTGTWSHHDTLRFNGHLTIVSREDNGHAYIENSNTEATNRALYPTRLVASGPTVDAISVNFPRHYQYRTESGHQKIDLPMSARANNNSRLDFTHLTGALCLMMQNDRTDHAITIDSIIVSSNKYRLSGSRNINLVKTDTLGPQATDVVADRKVVMTFTNESLVLNANGGNADVVIPVCPVGSDNIFTITVTAHYQGTRYTRTLSQGDISKPDRSLARNEIGYVPFSLNSNSTETIVSDLFSSDGEGNFLISSPTEFLLMAEAITNKWTVRAESRKHNTASYKLTANLDLAGITISPIRNYTTGTIYGDGKTVSNLTVTSYHGTHDTCALFTNLTENATIDNLILNNFTLKHTLNTSGYLLMGGFCGYMLKSTLQNCQLNGLNISVIGNISSATTYIGGLAARVGKTNTFTNCTVNIAPSLNLTSTLYFGNLLGHCNEGISSNCTLSVTDCNVTNSALSISTSDALTFGGLVGYTTREQLTLDNCRYSVTSGTLTSDGTVTAGGFLGRHVNVAANSTTVTIKKCTAVGTITTSGTSTTTGKLYGTTNNSINTSNNTTDEFSIN